MFRKVLIDSLQLQCRPIQRYLLAWVHLWSGSFGATHEGEEWGELGRQVTVRHDEGGVESEKGRWEEEMTRQGETEDSASSLAEVIYCQVRLLLGEMLQEDHLAHRSVLLQLPLGEMTIPYH
jgi:hypothetical protein